MIVRNGMLPLNIGNWSRHQELDDAIFDTYGDMFDFITEMMEYQHDGLKL